MSWLRAALAGAAVVFVAFIALVYVPDALVSSISGVSRSTRVALATAEFTVATAAILWGLRRMQARGLKR